MKTRITIAIAAAALLALGLSGPAFAFHNGGVAHCDGCHSMHNSAENPISGAPNNTLLKGSDPSSTCLNCHKSTANGTGYHIMSPDGSAVNQGGDFYWVTKDYSVVVRGNAVLFSKDNHGHNVVAIDYGMAADANPDNATAPGGSYPATSLGCHSCHDPHGQVNGGTANGTLPISASGSYAALWPTDGLSILGNYRLLGSVGYDPANEGDVSFTAAAPIALAVNPSGSSYGAIVDYGSGMSEWCANCHGQFVNDSHKHPAGNGEHLNGFGDNYNAYLATGNYVNGGAAQPYDALVPFERGVTDRTSVNWGNCAAGELCTDPVDGTDANSNVMCLTCHRAHASANANAGRWDFEVELLEESHALHATADAGLGTTALSANAAVYYKSGTNNMITNDIADEYGPYQRSLCNKCHVQD